MRTLIKVLVIAAVMLLLLRLCTPAHGDHPGTEYMPDMAHSVGYEANTYQNYWYNHWDDQSSFLKKDLSQPRKPVTGTIARGMTGVYYEGATALSKVRGKDTDHAIAAPVNGAAPFYYANTEADRTRASAEITVNPFNPTYRESVLQAKIAELETVMAGQAVGSADQKATAAQIEAAKASLKAETTKVMAKAKELYDIQCGICHGDKGEGDGYLARDGGPYPVAPANFKTDTFLNASDGRFYFAIMHGKNVMGSYADKLSFEERWLVIRHIRSLQQ